MNGQRKRLTTAWLVLVAFAVPAGAQTYPDRPVRLISDSAPGSAVDVGLRTIADGLSQHWGQQVLVVNQPGAGGAISARVAAEAVPDGYTLYAPALSVFLTLPGKAANLPVVLPRDFVPIGFTAEQPMSVGVSPKLGVNTLPELIALAKRRPGEISYAVSGVGRLTHMTGELLQMRAGIKLQMIPYTGGPHAALSDLVSGRVGIVIEGYSGLAGGLQGGMIKGIAVSSADRLPAFEKLATVAETLPGFFAGGWNVLLAPIGTPQPIIDKVSADIRKALDDADVKTKLSALGAFLRPMSPAEVTAFAQEQQRVWRPVAEKVAQDAAQQAR